MNPIITGFKSSPDRGRGLARDMRVRWALEELGLPFDVRLLTFPELKAAPYRKLHPFGQIPVYQEGEFVLFESGAIIYYLAQKRPGLLPEDEKARARALMWMFAALNTVEPPIVELSLFKIIESEKPWFKDRLPMLEERVKTRLTELSNRLGDSQWLDGAFSAGDLMMVTVLRRLDTSGLLPAHANICEYLKRAEARPAYQKAFAAQLAIYEDSLKKG
jgi:glutathione S-transferase